MTRETIQLLRTAATETGDTELLAALDSLETAEANLLVIGQPSQPLTRSKPPRRIRWFCGRGNVPMQQVVPRTFLTGAR